MINGDEHMTLENRNGPYNVIWQVVPGVPAGILKNEEKDSK